MTNSFDLLVIGDAPLMACGAARLGLRVAFAGRVGDDAAGEFVRAALVERGVELSGPATTAYDVPAELLWSVRHVHAASFYLMPELAEGLAALFKEARSNKATTSLDTDDDPSGRWDRIVLDPVLRVSDILFANAAEAHALTGHNVLADAAGILARRGPLVVVKDGAAGALAHDGSTVINRTALAVEAVDTVGVGDSFAAGYVAAVLKGFGRERALAIAAACGSLSTRAAGGTAAQASWDLAVESAG